MEWVNFIGKIFLRIASFLPCFFTILQYFTVLKAEQRAEPIGWIFLIASVFYFTVALTLLIKNW